MSRICIQPSKEETIKKIKEYVALYNRLPSRSDIMSYKAHLPYRLTDLFKELGINHLKRRQKDGNISSWKKHPFKIFVDSDKTFDRTKSVEDFLLELEEYTRIMNKPVRYADLTKSSKTWLYNRGIIFSQLVLENNIESVEAQQYSRVLLQRVAELIGRTILFEVKFQWTKLNKGYYRYDGQIQGTNILIEMDGENHFKQIPNSSINLEEYKKRDSIKTNLAKENGYTLYRFKYPNTPENIASFILENNPSIKSAEGVKPQFYFPFIQVAEILGKDDFTFEEYDKIRVENNLQIPSARSVASSYSLYYAQWYCFGTPRSRKLRAIRRIARKIIEFKNKTGCYPKTSRFKQDLDEWYTLFHSITGDYKLFLERLEEKGEKVYEYYE